jgi:uncharacterized protein with von Willebrand factor type A (vWA) domain
MKLTEGVLIAASGGMTTVIGTVMARRTSKESNAITASAQVIEAWKEMAREAAEEAKSLREALAEVDAARVKAEAECSAQLAELRAHIRELELRSEEQPPRRTRKRPDTPPPAGG